MSALHDVVATPPVISATGLRFTYPGAERAVLDRLDLTLASGVSLGILGANGEGKTTLMYSLVGGLLGKREGKVTIPANRSLIGFATQEVGLYKNLTIRENVHHSALLHLGMRRARQATGEAIEEFGLGDFAEVRSRHCSGGQRRLAHLACSLVHRPPLVLLDEPTVALDFETRSRILDLVRSWLRDGRSILVTAHYPEDLEEMCSHLALLSDGRLTMLGSTSEFLLRTGSNLEVTTEADGVVTTSHIPLDPSTVGALRNSTELANLPADAQLREIRIGARSLRSIIAEDPSFSSSKVDITGGEAEAP